MIAELTITVGTTEYRIYELASLAECASPDSGDTPGAYFLVGVAQSVADAYAFDRTQDVDDVVAEVADDAPSVYTDTMWREFVDLAAYREDLDELGVTDGGLEPQARICLYMIAERLARALWDAAREEEK